VYDQGDVVAFDELDAFEPFATAEAGDAAPAPSPRSPTRAELRRRSPRPALVWAVVLVPVAVVLAGGWAHRWVAEDAFIDFRVVHNLLAGHGPVFNVGERVEVYTDPLWVGILAVFSGLFPFVRIEWWSVILGLACAGGGVALGGLAAVRIQRERDQAALPVLPLGMLVVSAVAAVWDFSTSGLETGLVFLWLGLTWWLLVRVARRGHGQIATAAVAGLGPLIRPDMAILSAAFFAALMVVVCLPESEPPASRWRRWGAPVLAFVALPGLYQLLRMAYFGMLVPNTALAKSAGAAWWAQGGDYLLNFLDTYWLWIPMALLLIGTVHRVVRWWGTGDRIGAVVLLAPLVGGLLSALYVVRVGGDFMHARMLLPGFFAVALTMWVKPRRGLAAMTVVAAVGAWAVASVASFGYATRIGPHGISNERNLYVWMAGVPNPVTLSDYGRVPWARSGAALGKMAASSPGGTRLYLGTDIAPGPPVVVDGGIEARVIIPLSNIGITGFAAGSNVYVFDQLSLANPIGSHFVVKVRGRPGHEKVVSRDWMAARFTAPGQAVPPGDYSAKGIAAARAALGCEPLRGYLQAIAAPMTPWRAITDIAHSWTWTTMHLDPDPGNARAQLCGARSTGTAG